MLKKLWYVVLFVLELFRTNKVLKLSFYNDVDESGEDFGGIKNAYGSDTPVDKDTDELKDEKKTPAEKTKEFMDANKDKKSEESKDKKGADDKDKKSEKDEKKDDEPAADDKDDEKDDKKSEDESTDEDDEVQTIRIGKKDVPLSEIIEKTEKFFSEIDFKKLTPERKAELIESYINTHHIKEARRSVDKKLNEIGDKNREAERLIEESKTKLSKVEDKLSELETREKELSDAIKDYNKIIADDLDDEKVADARAERAAAKRELDRIKGTDDKPGELAKYEDAYSEIALQIQVDTIQKVVPELQTKEHVADIINKFNDKGAEAVEKEQYLKAKAVQRILNAYHKSKTKASIADFIEFNKEDFNLPNFSAAQSEEKKGDKKKTSNSIEGLTTKEILANMLKKQSSNAKSPKGNSKRDNSPVGNSEDDEADFDKKKFGY